MIDAQQTCCDLQNIHDIADSELTVVCHILDACIVLSALERAPEHHDTHPSHNIKTGGGFAHGNRLSAETLPALLLHAMHLVGSANDAMCDLKVKAVAALEGVTE
jgi:hypothetical protein